MAISTKTADDYDPNLPEKARLLRHLGRQALGEAWQYRLAQMRGVNLKTVNRWVMGQREVPDGLIEDLTAKARSVYDTGLIEAIAHLETHLAKYVDPHVFAAHISDLANRFRPVKTVPADKRYRNKRKPNQLSDEPASQPISRSNPS